MLKIQTICSALIGIFFNTAVSQAAYDPANDLMSAYGAGCSTSGTLTDTARSKTNSLQTIILSIADDSECNGIQSALETLDTTYVRTVTASGLLTDVLSAETASLTDQASAAAGALTLQQQGEKIAALNLAIASEEAAMAQAEAEFNAGQSRFCSGALSSIPLVTGSSCETFSYDTTYLDALKTQLITEQTTLLTTTTSYTSATYASAATSNRAAALQDMNSYVPTLFSALNSSAGCLRKHPNIGVQIAAQVVSIASGFLGGYLGAAAMITGAVTSQLVPFLQKLWTMDNARDLESTKMGEALECTIQSLAQTYCEARDLDYVIERNKSIHKALESKENKEWKGLHLLVEEASNFSNWLMQLSAGSNPFSSESANQKIGAVAMEAAFKSAVIGFKGLVADYRKRETISKQQNADLKPLYREATNDVISVILMSIQGYTSKGQQVPSLFKNFFSEDTMGLPQMYLYCKGTKKKFVPNPSNPFETQTTYINQNCPDAPSLTDLEALVEPIFADEAIQIALKKSIVLEDNPDLVLAKALTVETNGHAEYNFIQNLMDYIDSKDAEIVASGNTWLKSTLEDLKNRLVKAQAAYLNPPDESGKPKFKADKVTAELAYHLIPGGNTFYVLNAMNEIVKFDLGQKLDSMEKGDKENQLKLLLQLSSNFGLTEMSANFNDLNKSRDQADKAREYIRDSMTTLAKAFRYDFKKYLKKLTKRTQSSDASDWEKRNLARFCSKLSLLPDVAKEKYIVKACKGTQYDEEVAADSVKLSLVFNDNVVKDFDKRACGIYDFYRKAYVKSIKPNK